MCSIKYLSPEQIARGYSVEELGAYRYRVRYLGKSLGVFGTFYPRAHIQSIVEQVEKRKKKKAVEDG